MNLAPVFTKIISTGSYLPEKILTNDDLSKIVDTSDEWIVSRSGIRARHIADDKEETSDLALVSAQRALDAAGLDDPRGGDAGGGGPPL